MLMNFKIDCRELIPQGFETPGLRTTKITRHAYSNYVGGPWI